MNILLVVDGSSYSGVANRILEAFHLPNRTRVTVMTVVPEHTFLGGVTLGKLRGNAASKVEQQQKALELVQGLAEILGSTQLKVESMVRWGNPAGEILKEADKSGASLIVMGAKGLTDPLSFRLGSVAQTVLKHAKSSVMLVRETMATKGGAAPVNRTSLNRVLLATDGSNYSEAVTQLLLDLPLPRRCEVIVITALQSHLTAWVKTPTLDFQTNQELLARLQEAEEGEARKITTRSEKQLQARGYRTASVVIRGGAAESILAAAKEYKPDIIALGSRGLTGIESLLLGSVAERVARYANCSVLIGRPSPKTGTK
ncbi:MAG TPA: universal stress protein [Dehalococcoidia bacterium]|nr:universal stress protein [Dehalococcoidia bacterium]